MKYKYLSIISLVLFFSSCDIINPEEDIPAYLEILPYTYTVGSDGSNSTKITEAWIYTDGIFLGAFDLPKKIPVLNYGELEVIADPGIKENGDVFTPNIYPFYERYTETVNLVSGEVVTIQPGTRYDNSLIQLIFNENFNDSSLSFTDEMNKTTIDVKEGAGSGLIMLDAEDNPSVAVFSIPLERFPIQGNTAYLEVDYKTDVILNISAVGFDALGEETNPGLIYVLNVKDEWNKVYLNFSEVMNVLQQRNVQFYQLRIDAQIPTENGEFVMETAEIRFDNIKLITF